VPSRLVRHRTERPVGAGKWALPPPNCRASWVELTRHRPPYLGTGANVVISPGQNSRPQQFRDLLTDACDKGEWRSIETAPTSRRPCRSERSWVACYGKGKRSSSERSACRGSRGTGAGAGLSREAIIAGLTKRS
jgi:hypothetical protein